MIENCPNGIFMGAPSGNVDKGAPESVGNLVQGNMIVGSTTRAILVAIVADTVGLEILDNDILDNEIGIDIVEFVSGKEFSDNVAHGNNIVGNEIGVLNAHPMSFDATCNWWGAADGPSGDGPGSGDAVSGNVVFLPWLIDVAPVGACVGGLIPTLIADIEDADVHRENQLTNALSSALRHLNNGRLDQTCDALDRFIRHVERQVGQRKGITQAQADTWIDAAEEIKDELGCN